MIFMQEIKIEKKIRYLKNMKNMMKIKKMKKNIQMNKRKKLLIILLKDYIKNL